MKNQSAIPWPWAGLILTLALAGRYIHGPYYTATTLGLEIGYRFIARDLGGAAR